MVGPLRVARVSQLFMPFFITNTSFVCSTIIVSDQLLLLFYSFHGDSMSRAESTDFWGIYVGRVGGVAIIVK